MNVEAGGAKPALTVTGNEHFAASYPAVSASVPVIRRAIVDFALEAGATPDQTEAVRLASSEALTNVVVHAYGGGPGDVHVSADLASDEICVLIADDGCGLQAGGDSPGLGIGLALIAQACDGLEIVTRSSGGIEVRMRFSLGPDRLGDDQSLGSMRSAERPASSVFSTTR
jgi:anti-sigma regulatory factor (Ser/Thr protein kinase)